MFTILIFNLLILKEEIFDFGNALKSYVYSHRFWLKNEGEDTVKILSVRPTCGCSTAPLKNDVVFPGDSTYVKFIFDSRGFSGFTEKHAYIRPDKETVKKIGIRILLTDEYTVPFRIIPPIVKVRSSKDTLVGKILRIENLSSKKISLKVISFDEDLIKKIKIKKKELNNKEKIEIYLMVESSQNKYNGCITFEAYSQKEKYRFTVPVIWEIKR